MLESGLAPGRPWVPSPGPEDRKRKHRSELELCLVRCFWVVLAPEGLGGLLPPLCWAAHLH